MKVKRLMESVGSVFPEDRIDRILGMADQGADRKGDGQHEEQHDPAANASLPFDHLLFLASVVLLHFRISTDGNHVIAHARV